MRHRVSPEFIGSRNCTDGVHCRESTGPLALEVVLVTDAAFSDITMDQFMLASFFLNPLLYWYEVVIVCMF